MSANVKNQPGTTGNYIMDQYNARSHKNRAPSMGSKRIEGLGLKGRFIDKESESDQPQQKKRSAAEATLEANSDQTQTPGADKA